MTLRLRSLAALTLSLGLVLGSRMACAQNTDAQASFDQARTAFEAGQFGPALRGFQHVFEISGDHAVLFNIAVTYERLGQPGEAARTLRRFLVAEPDVSNRAEIEARIARLEDAERALASAAPAESASAPTNNTHAPTPVARPGHSSAVPWLIAGAGALVAAAGAIVVGTATLQYPNAPSDELRWQQAQTSAQTQYDVGWVFVGAGAAALVVGAIFVLLPSHESSPHVVVAPSRDGLTATIAWRFSCF